MFVVGCLFFIRRWMFDVHLSKRLSAYSLESMSIGIATTDSQDVSDVESLVKAADARMYRSKEKEGHAVTLADSK